MRLRTVTAIASALALSACGTPEKVYGVNWAGAASTPEPADYTPEFAARHSLSGWVALRCSVAEAQRLGKCQVLREAPAGLGFGEAALRMREGMRVTHRMNAIAFLPPPGATVQFPVIFCPPERLRDCDRAREDAFAYLETARARPAN